MTGIDTWKENESGSLFNASVFYSTAVRTIINHTNTWQTINNNGVHTHTRRILAQNCNQKLMIFSLSSHSFAKRAHVPHRSVECRRRPFNLPKTCIDILKHTLSPNMRIHKQQQKKNVYKYENEIIKSKEEKAKNNNNNKNRNEKKTLSVHMVFFSWAVMSFGCHC